MTHVRHRCGHAATTALRWTGFGLLLVLAGCAGLPWLSQAPDDEAGVAAEDDYSIGKMHLAAGRAGLAVQHFKVAVDRAPDSLDALNGLAAGYDSLGRHDLAARWYARALALDSGWAETLNNIGYSYLRQGRFDLAVAFLRDAHRHDQDAPLILQNRLAAETALARAGGPAPRYPVVADAIDPATRIGPARPRLVRSGRAVQTLITRPQVGPVESRQARWLDLSGYLPAPLPGRLRTGARTILPTYLAAPMRGADQRWMERRRP